MSNLKSWVNAARLRTLPLSISGILVGTGIASLYTTIDYLVFTLAIFTTVGFQVTSNFANDYGDGVKGTDNENRIGPKRALQSGLFSRKTLKRGIIVSIIIDVLLVIALLYFAFGVDNLFLSLLFLVLGGLSIWAAINYTIGNKAYGYRGLGDVFVFIFFGLVGVLGSLFLFIKTVPLTAVFPAISVGLLSVGVLNLNNLRDVVSDKESGKNTVVVKMGFENGKQYHTILLVVSFLAISIFTFLNYRHFSQLICLVAFIPIFSHLSFVRKNTSPKLLDPELKKLALSTFLMAVLFYISYLYFL